MCLLFFMDLSILIIEVGFLVPSDLANFDKVTISSGGDQAVSHVCSTVKLLYGQGARVFVNDVCCESSTRGAPRAPHRPSKDGPYLCHLASFNGKPNFHDIVSWKLP